MKDMDMFGDLEGLLKKHLEPKDEDSAEQQTDNEEDDGEEMVNYITGILAMKSRVELGKTVRARIDSVIGKLKNDLASCESSVAMLKVRRAAKELEILQVLLSSVVFTGVSALGGEEENMDSIVENIVRIAMM